MKIGSGARRGLAVVCSLAAFVVMGADGSIPAAASPASLSSASSSNVQLSPQVQVVVGKVLAAYRDYQLANDLYSSRLRAKKSARVQYESAMKTWQVFQKAKTKAKQQIGKSFKESVNRANDAYAAASTAGTDGSAIAEAKAVRNTAIALASIARSAALRTIDLRAEKPSKYPKQ
ncbi:MAG: hypothetical protein RLZZ626_1006 [Actinomycetota bacterium]